MRVRLTSIVLLACLFTTAAFNPQPTATAAEPAVALAPARTTITLGDAVPSHGTPPYPAPASCPLCALERSLRKSGAVSDTAIKAAIEREQLAGNLPAELTLLTAAQRATLNKAIQSVRLDLSKLKPDQLKEIYDIVKEHSKAKDRDDILASLLYYHEIAEGISKPVVITPQVKDGQVGILHPDGGEWMSLAEVKIAYRNRFTAPADWIALKAKWKSVAGLNRLFDVRRRHLTDSQFAELVQVLQEIESGIGAVSYRFWTGIKGGTERLKGLRSADHFDVRVDADSLAKVNWRGKLAIELLGREWEAKDILTGRVVEFLLAHREGKEGDIIDRLIAEAKEGKLKDKHIVLMFCADFTNPEVLEKLMKLRAAVLKGKDGEDAAASLLMPSKDLHVPGMTLAALAVKNDPSLLDSGGTPSQVVQRVFMRTAEMLEECKKADDPLKAIGKVFKNEKASDFFKKGGDKLDLGAIDYAIKRLRGDWIFFLQFVMDDGVKKYVC